MTTAAAATPEGSSLRTQVAEEVRAWLARRRMSGAQLARELGRSQTFIAKRLDGRQAFDVDDLEAVARILDVPAGALIPAQGPFTRPSSGGVSFRYRSVSRPELSLVPPLPDLSGAAATGTAAA